MQGCGKMIFGLNYLKVAEIQTFSDDFRRTKQGIIKVSDFSDV
ncbi:MAG: hypothetical protein O3A66_00385 [Proteobacteria bacterium]|jgi:hypothetical protein|nr:hypothetical protein [Pseudomonadota bacterium]